MASIHSIVELSLIVHAPEGRYAVESSATTWRRPRHVSSDHRSTRMVSNRARPLCPAVEGASEDGSGRRKIVARARETLPEASRPPANRRMSRWSAGRPAASCER